MAIEMFKKYITENHILLDLLITNEPTHTALQAATQHNVPVSNIVKSLLVKVDNMFCLFLVPGDKKLDLNYVKTKFSAKDVRMANADEVKEITGYSIGGVPPFGHRNKIQTYIENGFDNNLSLVAAGGSSNCVFKISLEKLKELISQ